MAIAASGAVSFSDLRTEYKGGSSAISYSDLYRGGANIKAKEGDNPATNLAASVPTSGVIDLADFHGTAKGFKATVSSSTTNVDINTLFGGDYDTNYPKVVDINSGVTIGGSGDDAIDIPSGLAGSLIINNAGTVIGFGGASAGAAGGHAINCATSGVVINNSGQISGGGGAGGTGGTGGSGGSGTYSTSSSSSSTSFSSSNYYWRWTAGRWGSTSWSHSGGSTSTSYGGATYSRGAYQYEIGDSGAYWAVTRTVSTTTNHSTSGGSGGSGGAGGVGQGYNQSAASGSGGSGGASGGTNAGSGGTGGTGGAGSAYGTAGGTGSTGNTGGNGNVGSGSGGSSGSSGGAAGAAVTGTSVTMNNTGTLHGAVA